MPRSRRDDDGRAVRFGRRHRIRGGGRGTSLEPPARWPLLNLHANLTVVESVFARRSVCVSPHTSVDRAESRRPRARRGTGPRPEAAPLSRGARRYHAARGGGRASATRQRPRTRLRAARAAHGGQPVCPARPVHVPGRDNISCVTNNLQKLAARASRPATARTRHPRHAARALDTRPGLGSSNALISASGFLRGVHGIFGRTRHLCEKGRGGGGNRRTCGSPRPPRAELQVADRIAALRVSEAYCIAAEGEHAARKHKE